MKTQRQIDEQALHALDVQCLLENTKTAINSAFALFEADAGPQAIEALNGLLKCAESLLAARAAAVRPVLQLKEPA